ISSCSAQNQDDSFSSLDDSLPCPRPGVVINDKFSSSPPDVIMIKKNETSQLSSMENDNFCYIKLDELESIFGTSLRLNLNVMLPKYIQWKKHFDKDDNDSLEFNLISFIEQLDDEEIYSYYTDAILELAKQWDDDHGCGIIDMIRFSIIDQLLCKRQLPGSPLDHSCPNKWIDQVCESVHDGQLNYMRPLKIYYSDDDLCSTKETELRNSMIMFKDKSVNEQIFFYHGTTEFHAENIITRGIRLFSRMSRPGDFGYGFYTTHSFSEALRHAKKGQQEQVVNNEPRALYLLCPQINLMVFN
ncbi:unnamed protein product, partial [Rotaria magnacalcarata]